MPVRQKCDGIFQEYLNVPVPVSRYKNRWLSFIGQEIGKPICVSIQQEIYLTKAGLCYIYFESAIDILYEFSP